MVIACNIITPDVRQLAVNLGILENRAVNLITYWLSEQQGDRKGRYPTIEELKEFMDKNQENLNDVYLALPLYQINDDLEVPIKTREDGIIEMRTLPTTNSLLYFYDLFKYSNELANIEENVNSYEEAYRFMLYREMAFILNKLSKNVQNATKADSLAIKKLIEYKKLNPKDKVKQSLEGATAILYTPVGQKEKTVYIKGNHIYNSKGEEIYKGNSVDRNKIYAKYSLRRGESVLVEYKENKYIVDLKSQIVSVRTGKIMQWGEENGDRKAILNLALNKFNIKKGIEPVSLDTAQNNSLKFSWARTSNNNYEVSTAGDRRFSALVAYFENASIVDGIDVSYLTIEDVYLTIIKKSRKGLPPSKNSKLYNENLKTEEEREEFSYKEGYLPLWQKWAELNPELIEELREKAKGKVLTDKFANTRVSQARALADILNQPTKHVNPSESSTGITSRDTALKNLEKELKKIINVGRSGYISVSEKDDILTLSTYNSGDDVSWTYLYRLDDSDNLLAYSNWTSDIPKDINTVEWKITTNENITKQKELILLYLKLNKKITTSTGNLQITPIRSIDNRAKDKGSISNKFIGFGEEGSSTNAYRVQAGDKANTGDYNSQDTIFVSVPGKMGNAETRKLYQDKTIKEAIKAIEAGATLITDNIDYINNSDYNEGEKRLYQNLEHKGYHYETITVGDSKVGKWTKLSTLKKEVWPKNDPLSKATEEKILEYHGYFEGGGATLNTVPTDLMNDVARYFMDNLPLSEERAQEFLQYVSMDPNQYALYSGGARGADSYWGQVALAYGMENVTHYRPEDITDTNRKEAEDKINLANKYLNRVYPMLPREATETKKARTLKLADYYNGLILRDTLLANSADAIFAIGQIKGNPTSDGVFHKSQVEGGTGWAVQVGINQGKPVYVFDQVRNQWYKNEGTAENRRFVPIQEAPKLTNNFAGIGTEHLNDKGRLAIKDVFINTFGYSKEVLESNTKSIFKDITGELETEGDFINPQDITIENSMDIMGALGIVSPTTNSLEIGELAGNAMDLPRPTIKNEAVLQQIEDESYQAYQTFSPQKLSDRCNMLYLIFDDVMTDLMEETLDNLEEDLDNAGTEESINIINKINSLNDEESGRHSLLQMVPFGEICDKVKERVTEEREGADSEYAALEYDKVLDNFDFLMARTCRIIEDRENLRIIPKKIKNAEGLITLQGIITKSTEDSEQEEANFLDNDEVTGEEHSGVPVNIKLKHPSKSISKITKNILLNIPEYGDNSTDDLEWTRYMKKGYTHAILLNELSKMVNAEHWYNPDGNTLRKKFPALAKMESRYPWVVGIMNRLYNDESAISAFFSDMYMPFNKQGKLSSSGLMILNDTIVADSVINQVLSMFESKLQINDHKTIWDKQGNYRTDVLLEMQNTLSKLNLTKEIQDKEERAEKASIITDLFKSIGIVLQKESINRKLKSAEEVLNIIGALSEASILVKGLIADNKDVHLISEYKTVYSKIAELIGELSPLQHKMTFREGGKDYPNYSVPSELEIMMKELTNPNKEERAKYIELNFKDSGFLYDPEKGKYRIKIILDLLDSDKIRLNLEIVTVRHAETWSGSTDYKDWDAETILDILRGAYFTPDNVKDHIHFSYYPIPIPSDTEAMFLLKLPSYRTTKKSTFKEKLLPLFREVVEQELYRINKVQQRRKNPSISKIVNYDKNGDRFFFFPYLNDYTTTVVSDTGEVQNMKFLDAVVYMNNSFKYNTLDITQLIDKAIVDTMDSYYNDYIGNVSDDDVESMATLALQSRYAGNEEVLKAALDKLRNSTLDNLGDPVEAHELMQEFFWNYCYALSQILQLTITDPAFYKDDNGVDIQKRFKLVIASGHRLNTQSKYGRKTSYNMVVLDKMIASYSYNGYKKALLIAVDRKWISKEYMDSVLEGYLDINAVDGQGIRSISSFKSVLHMLGKMTTPLEQALDNFEKGTPTKKDFLQVMLIIKPFLFGSTIEEDGLGGSMRIGRLIKNSEMPLLSGLAIVAKGILGKSSFFNAIHEFMELHSIDTLQFESCIKTGGLGIIDIHFSQNKLNKYIDEHKDAWELIQEAADESAKTDREKWESGNKELLKSGKITQEEFNKRLSYTEPSKKEIQEVLTKHIINEDFDPTIDREDPQYVNRFKKGSIISLPYSKMMIAQPTPEHLFDTVSKIGSQIQNIAPADLPDDIEFNIKGVKLKKQQFLDLYDSIFVANKVDAFLKVQDKFNDVSALSNMLLEKVLDNPKYGRQYLDALMLVDDPNNPGLKIFNVGFDFPSMRQQIAELMLSTFKRAVTVQEITGGNAILTSSFIFTDQLKTEFKEDGGIKCAPCYLPAHSRKFYEPFMDKDGIIDIDKIPLELREMISYRIPTEGKYSTLPIRVVGFLPSICGSAIMLPVDISYIAGEDYDVDKRFLMIPAFRMVNKYNFKKAELDFFEAHPEYKTKLKEERKRQFSEFLLEYQKAKELDPNLEDKINDKNTYLEWLNSKNIKTTEWLPEVSNAWKNWWKAVDKSKYIIGKKAVKINMDISKLKDNPSTDNIIEIMSKSKKEERDNLLIELLLAILTHPLVAHQIANPGHFNSIKRGAKTGTLLGDPSMRKEYMQDRDITDPVQMYESLKSLSVKQLALEVAKYSPSRPVIVPSTFVYNHLQNMTAGKLVGNYANNTTSQTKLQSTDIGIAPLNRIIFNGRLINSVSEMYTGTLPDGTSLLISKNCSETSASSVDDVKDPNLKQLGQNPNTAKILGGMLRAGLTVEEASLFFHLPAVKSLIALKGKINRWELEEYIAYLYDDMQGTENSKFKAVKAWAYKNYGTTSITTENLVRTIAGAESKEERLKTYLAFYNMVVASEYLSQLTMNSRQDSPNGAISHTLGGSIKQIMNLNSIHIESLQLGYPLTNVTSDFIQPNLLSKVPSIATSNKIDIIKLIMGTKMRRLQAAYTLGIEKSKELVDLYFAVQNKMLLDMLMELSKYAEVSETTISLILLEFINYMCSKTELLGDTEEDSMNYKIEYYKNLFPKKAPALVDSILELKDNPTIKSFSFNKIVSLKDSARLSEEQKQQHMDNLDRLLLSDNPKVVQFAEDLYLHTFYVDGFNFGPNSIGRLFSISYINKFKEVRDLFRYMPNSVTSKDVLDFMQKVMASSYVTALLPTIQSAKAIAMGENGSYIYNITEVPNVTIDGVLLVALFTLIEVLNPLGFPMRIPAYLSSIKENVKLATYTPYEYSYNLKFNANTSLELALLEAKAEDPIDNIEEEIKRKIEENKEFLERQQFLNTDPDLSGDPYSTEEGLLELVNSGGEKLC